MDLSKVSDYQSLKTVKAIEIKEILFDQETASKKSRNPNGSAILIPKLKKYKQIRVNDRFAKDNNLTPGGYLVFEGDSKKFLSQEEFASQFEITPVEKETEEKKEVIKKVKTPKK